MPTPDQAAKFAIFKLLHDRPGAFVIPNPWDASTARILTALGFEALATTSAGYAFSVGHRARVAELERVGVKRIRVGGSFARAALGGFVRAACEVREHGTFTYAAAAMSNAEATAYMAASGGNGLVLCPQPVNLSPGR
jgi:2-methylisocitrate lyase-like PEP mutase family enzyme